MLEFGLVTILFIIVAGTALYIWSLVWAYKDAEKRGSNGVLVCLLVALVAWPLGIVVWLLVRPDRAW